MGDSAGDLLDSGDAPEGGAPAATGTPGTPPDGGSPAVTDKVEVPEWFGEVDPDTAAYVSGKGWAEPKDLVESYRNVERMVGGKVAIPDEGDEKGWGTLYDRLGRPASGNEYDLGTPPEHLPEGMGDWYKGLAHEMGLNQAQAAAGFTKMSEYLAESQQAATSANEERDSQQMIQLKAEWGSNYDGEIQAGKAAAKAFGFTADEIDAMAGSIGVGETLKRFAAMGHKIGEHGAEGEESTHAGFGMSKEKASARHAELMANPQFSARYQSGDKEALKEVDRLMQIIAS